MSVTVPIQVKTGRLPLAYEFTPANYRPLLLQRLELQLNGDNVLLGSSDLTIAPIRNIGAWFNPSTKSWWTWNDSTAQYEPIEIGFVSGNFGTTINAAPTANRTLTLPDGPGFTDGVANSSTTYTSATAEFTTDDIGLSIAGTNIPANTTISSRTNATTIILSQAATATASGLTFHVGRPGSAVILTDISIPKETVVLTSTGGAASTIDANVSNNFFLTLTENTTIPSITNMTTGKRIKIAIVNAGTSYTVTWPTVGANAIKWPTSPSHTQPVATEGRPSALAIYTITELTVGALTPHLWGDPEVTNFNLGSGEIDPGGLGNLTDPVRDIYRGANLPLHKGILPYNIP